MLGGSGCRQTFTESVSRRPTPRAQAKLSAGTQGKELGSCAWPEQACEGAAVWEDVWRFLIKLNIVLARDPAVPFLGFYPKGQKQTSKQTGMRVFTHVVFLDLGLH